MDMTGRYAARLRRFYDGRKLILTGAPLAMLRGTSRMVRSLGAARPFLLAAGVGTGPLPSEEEGDRHVLQLTAPDIVSETRTIMSLLANLPAEALAALDRYDPDHEALVLSPPANELRSIAGRRVYAPRRPSWRRLEDKTLIDKLWDAHGIRRPPSERCGPATPARGLTAARSTSAGCVKSGMRPRRSPSSRSIATEPGWCRSSRACRAASTVWCWPTGWPCCARSR